MTRQPANTHEPRTRRASLRKRLQAQARRGEGNHGPVLEVADTAPSSPLADWLMDPTPERAALMLRTAALGEMTHRDMMAAIVAELRLLAEAMGRPGFELVRPSLVARHRLLSTMSKAVTPSRSSGIVQAVRVVWPAHYTEGEPCGLAEPPHPFEMAVRRWTLRPQTFAYVFCPGGVAA